MLQGGSWVRGRSVEAESETVEAGDFTRLLQSAESGDRESQDQLFRQVYDELRQLARRAMAGESPGHTLQATALVSEAYLRLGGDQGWNWQSRAHFFWAAGEVMRRVLIDQARKHQALKRGAGSARVSLSLCPPEETTEALDLLALDEALTKLEDRDERKARVVKLRYFCGLSLEETAAVLGVTRRVVDEDWRMAKAWLRRELERGG